MLAIIAAIATYEQNLWDYWVTDRRDYDGWDNEKRGTFQVSDQLYDELCQSNSVTANQYDAAYMLGSKAAKSTRARYEFLDK